MGRFPQRIVTGRIFLHAGQHGALGLAQLLRIFIVIEPGRLGDAPGTVAVIDLVEIHLQDLLFAVFLLKIHGHAGFIDLPFQGFSEWGRQCMQLRGGL